MHQRNYKDTMFRMIFKEPEELLSLFNALNGTNYDDPSELTIVTLENAIYMNRKEDVSFLIHDELQLYEHQSTFNPNMPLRSLFYVAKQLEGMLTEHSLYTTKQVKIPTPTFVVFYNGEKEVEEVVTLKLSDAFKVTKDTINLELVVLMVNINAGKNVELMETCKTLKEYATYVAYIRSYAREMPLEDAVERTIDRCIEENILRKFLKKWRSEAKQMSIFEFNQEIYEKQEHEYWQEIGYDKGHKEGQALGVDSLLITQVLQKVKLGKDLPTIQEALGVKEEQVERIYEYIQKHQETEIEKIREGLLKLEK